MCKKYLPIGVFDSGVGGITVLKACADILPYENFVYYGDTKNSPYGNLDDQKITRLTFDAVDRLISRSVKAVVIACNTATAAAINALRNKHDIEIIGIEPAIKPACIMTNDKILVMLTKAAARQTKLQSLIKQCGPQKVIICPLSDLARNIEQNIGRFGELEEYINKILSPYKDYDIKAVVLGCTHYIFVKNIIAKVFPQAVLYDGNAGVARYLKNMLINKGLLNDQTQKGNIEFFSSDNKYQSIYQNLWSKYINIF
ncbi:MAG TPA: glutamate racemase [Clostridiales bacterium]|nr:glutamate racemase [Clostridiales bacterium]